MNECMKRSRRGFNLIELVVVMAVIGILMGLLMTAIQPVRGAAARLACANNIRQLVLACQHYHDQHGCLPPAYAEFQFQKRTNLNWLTLLLPFVEQENLYARTLQAYRAEPVYVFNNPPHIGLATVVKVYTCPADGRLTAPITDDKGYTAAYGSYLATNPPPTPPNDRSAIRSLVGVRLTEVTDGTSNTLMIGERPPPGRLFSGNWYMFSVTDAITSDPNYAGAGITGCWVYYPDNIRQCTGPFRFGPGRIDNPCDSNHFWSLHRGGANFAFCDGSVRFLRYDAAPIMVDLATRDGGEVVAHPN